MFNANIQMSSYQHIKRTHDTQPQNHRNPETHVVEQRPSSDEVGPLQRYNGELQHHREESVAAQFLCDAAHDELMQQCRYQERDGGAGAFGDVGTRSRIHVTPQEVVHGNVPLARELEPREGMSAKALRQRGGGEFEEGVPTSHTSSTSPNRSAGPQST